MTKEVESKTVLVLEDEVTVRSFACRVLELEGYKVTETEDAAVAITTLKADKIDLVLMDLRVPGGGGWAVLEHIKGESKLSETPVIVFTASADPPQRERALEMGAAEYLVKPLSASALREAVARVMCKDNGREEAMLSRRPLILVVDDDIRIRRMMQRVLELEDFRTLAVSDGQAALNAFD